MPFRTIRRYSGLFCALSLAAGAAQANEPLDTRTLSESKVSLVDMTKPGSPGKSFVAGTLIDAPVGKLCAIIQNYKEYPGFMPNTESVRIAETGAAHAVIEVTLKLPMGKIKKYKLRMEPKSSPDTCTVAWKLVPWPGLKTEETIADTTGQWQLAPLAGSGKTVVKYVVYTDPGPIPFGLGWIVDSLSKDSIPQTLDALRKRAARP